MEIKEYEEELKMLYGMVMKDKDYRLAFEILQQGMVATIVVQEEVKSND